MSIFAHPTAAPVPKTKDTRTISLFYVGILVVIALAQLFTFDEFLKLFTSFELIGGAKFAHFIAAFVVVAEVFALPFLLRMRVSPAFRWLSMILGWLVAIIWFAVSLTLYLSHSPINNVGYLGTAVSIMPSAWTTAISVAFGVFAAWSSWGMWPGVRARTVAKKK